MKICSARDCDRKHYALGMCKMHWRRLNRHGNLDVHPPGRSGPPLEFVKKAILHKGNDCLLWPYAKTNEGYGHLSFLGKHKLAHRMVLSAWKRCPGHKLVCAHLCGNGHLGCVNPQHLAWATQSENLMHRAFHLSAPAGP